MISSSDTTCAVLIISLALVAVISSATAIWYRMRYKSIHRLWITAEQWIASEVTQYLNQIQAQRNAPKIPQPTKDQTL